MNLIRRLSASYSPDTAPSFIPFYERDFKSKTMVGQNYLYRKSARAEINSAPTKRPGIVPFMGIVAVRWIGSY
ncbi:MAG TPA: hypothetical protein ACFYD2_11430, partial [Candidatus Avalokitesvara rifleensis]|uniref:hypothetical protein n=1 Tax=Candidatus Avalokitesvara rifleensis TaxID=3367620 RepID=UPI004028EDE1